MSDSAKPTFLRSHRSVFFALAVLVGVGGMALAYRWMNPVLIHVVSPTRGQVVGLGGLEVVVRFERPQSIDAQSFRVQLNGSDVTEEFTAAENGAYGRLVILPDGENVLRLRVGGRGVWPLQDQIEDSAEVRFLVRRPIDLNRG